MWTIALFSTVLSVTSALTLAPDFPPLDLNTTCAATLCQVGTTCIQETTGSITRARCVENKPVDPCATVKCGFGQECVLQQVYCIRAPCNPQPTCVDNVVKPGRCREPSPFEVSICGFTCKTDGECQGPQKCCRNSCGSTSCQDPQGLIPEPIGSTCEAKRCGAGKRCVMQEVLCIRSPCPPQPTCVDINKRGQCPKPGPFEVGVCGGPSDCNDDSHCPGSQKCCRNACGTPSCQSPVTPVLTPVKPSCKTVKCGPGEKCIMPQLRCFRAPCPEPRPQCVPTNKPGVCPKTRFSRFSFFFCRERCQSDRQCPGAQKCCRSGCSAVCKDPELVARPTLTCATLDCRPDFECKMRKTRCNRQGCDSEPRCEPVRRCPVYPALLHHNCPRRDMCSETDPNACAPGTMCCSTACGRRCVRPMPL